MTRRAINKEGLELIKSFEGCKLTSYLCPAKVWTVGFGSTGSHVKPGMTITKDQAEELLRSDLRRFEDAVAAAAPKATDNQFSAMVSLQYRDRRASAFTRAAPPPCGRSRRRGRCLRHVE